MVALDYNGDGKDDVIAYRPGSGIAVVYQSNGSTFTNKKLYRYGIEGYNLRSSRDLIMSLDYDGNGKDDIVMYRPGSKLFFLMKSDGDATFTRKVNSNSGFSSFDLASSKDRLVALDYNGDGNEDIVAYRPGSRIFSLHKSWSNTYFTPIINNSNGHMSFDFSSSNDKIVALDYNGDGKTDLMHYRPGGNRTVIYGHSNGIYYVRDY